MQVILRLLTKSHIHIIKVGRLDSDILDDDKIIFFFLSIFSDTLRYTKSNIEDSETVDKITHIHY